MKTRTFVDSVNLHAKAGRGGDGCVGFRREKYVPLGGPDGGDGGRGGHVVLVCNRNEDSLLRIYYVPTQCAADGGRGQGQQMHGRNGKDCEVNVPPGTEVRNAETGELLCDLTRHGDTFIAAKGGKGGFGNCHWKSSTNRAPRQFTEGEPGEEVRLSLELKLIADIGLVGFPNAGKSSLLTKLTDAHPRIAPYPFTTLNPIIGTLVNDDASRVTVADMPGLIEGAHAGVGLGHQFLRHVARASVLAFVLDMAGVDGRKPWDDYRNLRKELRLHDPALAKRTTLVIANKMDLPEAADLLREFKRKTRTKPICISAEAGDGIEEVKRVFFDAVRALR